MNKNNTFVKIPNNKTVILLVDDDKDILDLFSAYLSFNGFNTKSFQNPLEALKYFYQNANDCSMIITDYKMPEMSGIDLIKKIKEKEIIAGYKIKTVIMSACIKDNIFYDKSYVKQVDRILEKPIYLDTLKKVVQELELIPKLAVCKQ